MKKNVIITGGNSGLGYECAKQIAAKKDEYCVILACRNADKVQIAKNSIIAETGNQDILTLSLDLASLDSVRNFAKGYKAMNLPLYALVCNAGGVHFNKEKTEDGIDYVFQSNHLGHFLLTMLLMDKMQENARIISVSSDMHCPPTGELTWYGSEKLAYLDDSFIDPRSRYSYSKLCNLYFTYELAKRLKQKGSTVVANAFNPGLMTETNFSPNKTRFTPEFLSSVADRIGSLKGSSEALAELVMEYEFGKTTGLYYSMNTKAVKSSPISYNEENANELWNESIRLSKLKQVEAMI